MTHLEFKGLREGLGLTQGQAARLLGVDRVTVARWEIRARRISEPAARLWLRICSEERARRESGKER